MRRPPRDPAAGIMDRGGLLWVLALGAAVATVTLGLFWSYLADPARAARAQTVAFTGIIVAEKLNVFNFRVLEQPLRWRFALSNPWLLLAVGSMVALQALAVYLPPLQAVLHTVPLTARDWGWILLAASPVFVVPELAKRLRPRLQRLES